MQYERDTEWPEKFQLAVFAANMQYLDRDYNPFGLLKLVTGSLEDLFEDDVSDDEKSVVVISFAVVFISKVRIIRKLLFIN